MRVYEHDYHIYYKFTEKLGAMRFKNKIKFFHKGKSLKNARFKIYPHKEWQYFHWFIRLPFFYFERNNSGIRIGTPNSYLWFMKFYRK